MEKATEAHGTRKRFLIRIWAGLFPRQAGDMASLELQNRER